MTTGLIEIIDGNDYLGRLIPQEGNLSNKDFLFSSATTFEHNVHNSSNDILIYYYRSTSPAS